MAGHRTMIGAALTGALFFTPLDSSTQAQSPGMMGCDLPSIKRMPLLMPDDFSEMNLVTWRVERGTPDPDNPLRIFPSTGWPAMTWAPTALPSGISTASRTCRHCGPSSAEPGIERKCRLPLEPRPRRCPASGSRRSAAMMCCKVWARPCIPAASVGSHEACRHN
jgi:hypothetical protein